MYLGATQTNALFVGIGLFIVALQIAYLARARKTRQPKADHPNDSLPVPPPVETAPAPPPVSKPKLRIEFDASQPGTFTPERPFADGRPPQIIWQRKYLNDCIWNDGDAQASDCRGTITPLNAVDGCSGPTEREVDLRWDDGGVTRMDIHPNQE